MITDTRERQTKCLPRHTRALPIAMPACPGCVQSSSPVGSLMASDNTAAFPPARGSSAMGHGSLLPPPLFLPPPDLNSKQTVKSSVPQRVHQTVQTKYPTYSQNY